MIKKFLLIVGSSIILSSASTAQIERSGFNFGVSAGTGYSRHAAAYSAQKIGGFPGHVTDFGGFRAFTLNTKLGWGVTPRAQVFYAIRYTPPNTTISPYQAFYQGLLVNYSAGYLGDIIFGLGAGISKVSDKNEGSIAQGTLVYLSVAHEFSPHFQIELSSLFGKMNNSPPPLSSFDSSAEFSLYFTLNYIFYKDKGD